MTKFLLPPSDDHRKVANEGLRRLTPRERQVLACIVNGASSKKSGEMLGISYRTVEAHKLRVMEKLQTHNLVELIRVIAHIELEKK